MTIGRQILSLLRLPISPRPLAQFGTALVQPDPVWHSYAMVTSRYDSGGTAVVEMMR